MQDCILKQSNDNEGMRENTKGSEETRKGLGRKRDPWRRKGAGADDASKSSFYDVFVRDGCVCLLSGSIPCGKTVFFYRVEIWDIEDGYGVLFDSVFSV